MRNKWILSILMAILALPFFSGAVLAETTSNFEDGTYEEIDYIVKHETKDEASIADGYFTKPATLIVENGKQAIQLELTSSNMIESLKVNGKDVETIGENEAENKRFVKFVVDGDLSEVVKMEIHVVVPSVYDEIHDARAFFDISQVPEKIEEKPTEPVEPEKPSQPTESEDPVDNDGDKIENTDPALVPDEAFKINFISTSRSVNSSFINPAILLIKDGEKYIQMTTTSSGRLINLLAINDKEVTYGEKNSDGSFTFQFKVDSPLEKELDFYMEINAGPMGLMKHNVDLAFDERTQEVIDINDYMLLPVSNNPEENNDDEESTDVEDTALGENPSGKEEDNGSEDKDIPAANDSKDNKDNDKPKTPDKKDQLTPDKAYKIDFVIKHETDDKPSAADSFFKGPAILLEKDGERYVQITVMGSEFINSLMTKHGDMVVVKNNEDGSIVVQFKVDGKLSDVIELDMMITVPGVYENQEHKARLFLMESSMEEIAVSDYRLVASNNGNGPKVDGGPVENTPLPGAKDKTPKANDNKTNTDPTIEKPELDSNEKNGSTNETKIAGQEKNPQTGDTTNILLYVLLLIGSAIPLAVMAKRRFANVA